MLSCPLVAVLNNLTFEQLEFKFWFWTTNLLYIWLFFIFVFVFCLWLMYHLVETLLRNSSLNNFVNDCTYTKQNGYYVISNIILRDHHHTSGPPVTKVSLHSAQRFSPVLCGYSLEYVWQKLVLDFLGPVGFSEALLSRSSAWMSAGWGSLDCTVHLWLI
jgi:hypothetical protein